MQYVPESYTGLTLELCSVYPPKGLGTCTPLTALRMTRELRRTPAPPILVTFRITKDVNLQLELSTDLQEHMSSRGVYKQKLYDLELVYVIGTLQLQSN